ncbi:4Fe-4S binding protein [Anaerovorax odorimutans]|uniref:4Fe-4S binding protein n=1 Tax=Anaerovorax odorimutans TaxID=109327 RepID=UPI00040614A9|nr:4Fe-4S binding protein [Anaerovorax odorimutans]
MKTNFLGLKLKNPIIVAAGPWNRDGINIRKGIAAGAGAVITETIVSDALLDVRPRIAYNGTGAQNIRLYSDIQVESWQREMDIAKSKDSIVIASVSAHTPSELAYLAMKMEKFGADAIELSISSPMGESLEVVASNADRVYQMTKEVVENIKIPVMVKLSQNATNISKVAKTVKKAGGSGVSAINTIRCILGVDIETMKPMLPTYGGYSGVPIRPLGLASVATIAQTVDIPLCGIGGIENYKNALEYISLGASAVQIGTSVMLNGFDVITKIVNDLEKWFDENDIKDIKEIRGQALKHLKSFEEIKIEPITCHSDDKECAENCHLCMNSCIYGAITREEGIIKIDKEKCTGCGLCNFICPVKKLRLDW